MDHSIEGIVSSSRLRSRLNAVQMIENILFLSAAVNDDLI